MNYVPAEPGWLVKFSDGSTAPVVAWQIVLDGGAAQALPITTEMARLNVFELIPPTRKE